MAGFSKTDHRANRLLAATNPDDYARLEPDLEIVNLPRGTVIYEVGETMRHTYFPHDAIVSLVAVMEDGATAEIGVFGCEGVLGSVSASNSRESLGRYVVQVPGTASRIKVERLKEAVEASRALQELSRCYLEALLAQTFQSVACNAVHGYRGAVLPLDPEHP
jgi:CRP-like cAMP-binding protein